MLDKKNAIAAILALAGCVGAVHTAGAQQGLAAPRPLTSPQPPQPTIAEGVPVEGWVTVRYSVLADGTPSNIRAINHMPPGIDPSPTLETFRQWTFSPGMENGEAIDWHNNETVVVFRSQTAAAAAAAEFDEAYAGIAAMIDAGDFDAAAAASEDLLNRQATSLADIGLALAQSSLIHLSRLDFHSALRPARMATDRRVPMLSGNELFPALQIRMQIEVDLGRAREALTSYQRLARGLGPNETPPFAEQGERLAEVVENEEFVAIEGRIDDGSWRIDTGRPFFYIAQIDGNIRSIGAECDTRRISLEFQADADYQLPESFGDCTLFVNGESGTTFSFIEVLPPPE